MKYWNYIAIDRNTQSVDRHFYMLYITENGFGGNFIWKIPSRRLPFSRLIEFFKLRSWKSLNPEKAVTMNEKNFFIPFDKIQGIVTDDEHKEIQILTSTELMRIIIRSGSNFIGKRLMKNDTQYEEITKAFDEEQAIKEKIHPKEVNYKMSLEQGYN